MKTHFDLTDAEFEQQFKSSRLDPALFSHEAHLRLAWIHLKNYGREQAISNICGQLFAFVTFLNARDKYNQTLTIAAVKAVDHFMKKSNSENFADFINEFPRLKNNFRELMSFHYQTDIYNSEKAKLEFLEPDLAPFD